MNTSANNWAITISRNKQFSNHDEVRQYLRTRDVVDMEQQDQKSVPAGGGGIIYAGLFFSPMQMQSNHFSQRRVCVQSPGAPIFQLINFIFTHLFLNVLSDGNAAGCSSEVLPRQTGLKRGSEPVSEAGFQFEVEGSLSFIIHWKLSKESVHRVLSVVLFQYKRCLNVFQWGKNISNAFVFLLKDSNGQIYSEAATLSVILLHGSSTGNYPSVNATKQH